MKSYTVTEYINAGCRELAIPVMRGVYDITQGRVCDTGCWHFDRGKCPAYKKMTTGVVPV